MKIKFLLASLVLAATSAVALARPVAPGYAPPIRDHRTQPRFERWSVLATGHLTRGRDVVAINRAAKIDKLKLELVGTGSIFIDKLVLTFGNGRTRTVEVDKWLSARAASAIVDVNGNARARARKLTSVTVIGRGNSNGFRAGASFKLLAL